MKIKYIKSIVCIIFEAKINKKNKLFFLWRKLNERWNAGNVKTSAKNAGGDAKSPKRAWKFDCK